MRATLLIEHLEQLYTVAGDGPRSGRDQGDIASIAGGAVACNGATIVAAGRTEDVRAQIALAPDAKVVDGRGHSLVPGFIDPHTHVVFAGDRRDELRRRLGGATYADIAADGGGILSTVRATRAASDDELVAQSGARLSEMLKQGTTTAEAKSGYGLDVETEVRMLQAVARLNATQPIELVATF